MTNIELLKDIQEHYDWENGVFYKDKFELLKKDLKMLNRLKLICYAEDDGIIIYGTMNDFLVIKEWLYEDENKY